MIPNGELCTVTISDNDGPPRLTTGRRFGNLVAVLDDEGNHSIIHALTGMRVCVIRSNSITVAMFHVERLCGLSPWAFTTVEHALRYEPDLPAKIAAYAKRWRTVEAHIGTRRVHAPNGA